MLRIGLTGGMGAGKSTVAKLLAERGAVIVDADKIAREVVEPGTPGLAALVEAFGADILQPNGSLDRQALADKAFRDDDARTTLNSITHPLVGQRVMEIIERAPTDAILVQDIPLLVENRTGPVFNLVIVVGVDEEERVHRLVSYRKIAEHDARARIAAQATDEQRRAAADVWLDNSGPEGAVEAEVAELWEQRLIPFERNLRERRALPIHAELVPHDPTWAAQAARLVQRLQLVCGERAVRVDHVGSTAVPDIVARDIIDLQITVKDLETADALADTLADAGIPRIEDVTGETPKPAYAVGGEADPALWAERMHGTADPGRLARIHLRVDGWPGQRFALLLRDWLRAEPEERAAFQSAKHRARTDPDVSYADALAPWFDGAYRRSEQWAQRTGWTPNAS
ncbi:MAG: dephospho-CoA kinase [Aldersonia sp.]|nr:dephospho-CoA kinase [Aldersonia sp.]